jgi:hypothetical protein
MPEICLNLTGASLGIEMLEIEIIGIELLHRLSALPRLQ